MIHNVESGGVENGGVDVENDVLSAVNKTMPSH